MTDDEYAAWLTENERDFRTYGPVRLCCGERHYGARCPDGRVMCSHCFERFPDDELMRDEHDRSKRWDVCLECGYRENVFGLFLVMAGGFKRPPRETVGG